MSHPRSTLRVLLSSFLFVSAALLPGTVFAHGANTKVHHVSPAVVQELQTLTTGLVAADQPLLSAEAAAAQNALGQQVNIAARRSALMEQVAAEDPTVFLQNVLPSSIREQLPPAVQLIIEQPVTLTGVMEVLHVDDFSNSDNSHFTYHMRVGDVRLAFYPVGTPPAMSSGSTAQVTGYRIGQSVVAVGGSGGVEVLEQALPDATGVQRTLAVLVTAPGKPILLTPAQVKAAVFSRGFQAFYKEQSYNKVSFTGDTTEWITVPAYATDMCYGGGSLITLSQTEIQNYFVTKNIDLSQYGRVVLLINGLSGGCAYVGKVGQMVNNKTYTLSLGWVGSPTSVPAAGTPGLTMFEYVLAHEVGHELGVMHANAWHCAGPSLDVDCTHAEYGNGYDVMGGGYSVSHFNAFYKNLLGWLDDASKVSITTAGTYTVAPLETASGLRAGIITNPGSPTAQPLYVEYRRPIGFDAGLVPASIGLFLNQVIAPSTAFPFPRLLNANYATTNIGGQMQPLTQGGVFSWNTRGIKITANTVATSSATFDVVFTPPICTRVGITAINVYASAPVLLGGIGYVQFEAINNDTVGCPSSTISIAPSIAPSTGTTLSQYPTGSVTLAPGESSYFTVWFYTSQSSLVGESVITTTITDTTNARTHVFSKAVTIVGPNTLPLGYFDAANCTTLSGWAYDPDVASTSINVTVKEGDTILLTTPANKLRNDVNTARNITGKHGFSVSTPLSLKDNKPHTLSAYAVDSNGKDVAQLQLSPKAITCGVTPPASGILRISKDPSSPAYRIVSGGNEVLLGSVHFKATKEAMALSRVGVTLTQGKIQDVEQVSVYDGTTLLGTALFTTTSTTTVLFSTLTHLPQDTNKTLTLKATLAQVGGGKPGVSGDLVKIDVTAAGTYGVGASSDTVVPVIGTTTFAGVRVFRSYPTVTLDPLPANLTDTRLMRFKVTADASGAVYLYRVGLSVSPEFGIVKAVNVFGFTDSLYTSPIQGLSAGGKIRVKDLCAAGCSATSTVLRFIAQTAAAAPTVITIPAGQTRYFEVRGDLSGTGTGPYGVTTTLLYDKGYGGVSTATGVPGHFIWSDNAVGTISLTDKDFMNGQGVPGLAPLGLMQAREVAASGVLPLGYFDAANCTTLSGWAYDPDVASTSINVTVKEGDTILLTTPANKLRNDVNTARNITGKHGFSVSTPLSLKDNKPHTLSAYAVDSNGKDVAQLQLSPKAITCGA